MIEMDMNVGEGLRYVHQSGIERGARNRIDDFFLIDAIRMELGRTIHLMDHAPFQRNREVKNPAHIDDFGQGSESPYRQCHVDRPAAIDAGCAKVGTHFINVNIPAAAGQKHSHHCSGQAGTHDCNILLSYRGHVLSIQGVKFAEKL